MTCKHASSCQAVTRAAASVCHCVRAWLSFLRHTGPDDTLWLPTDRWTDRRLQRDGEMHRISNSKLCKLSYTYVGTTKESGQCFRIGTGPVSVCHGIILCMSLIPQQPLPLHLSACIECAESRVILFPGGLGRPTSSTRGSPTAVQRPSADVDSQSLATD